MKNRSPIPNQKSFKECVLKELENRINRGEIRNPQNHYSALNHLWRALGTEVDRPSKYQLPASFAEVPTRWLKSGLALATVRLYAVITRNLMAKVVKCGLNPKCVAALRIPRRECPDEAAESLVQKSHLKTILKLVESQIETLRILIWFAFSAGSFIGDAVFLQLASVNWATGLISYRKQKTGQLVQFGALPPLLELLKLRKDRFGPGAIYALPELIYTTDELRNPACNTIAWDRVPDPIAVRATANANKAVKEFFGLCGFNAEDISFKSLRRHNITFWHDVGISAKTCMRMSGYNQPETHDRYCTASEIEILRAKEIMWQHLEAVREERDFHISATPYELLAAFNQQRVVFEQRLKAQQFLLEECRNLLVRLVPPQAT